MPRRGSLAIAYDPVNSTITDDTGTARPYPAMSEPERMAMRAAVLTKLQSVFHVAVPTNFDLWLALTDIPDPGASLEDYVDMRLEMASAPGASHHRIDRAMATRTLRYRNYDNRVECRTSYKVEHDPGTGFGPWSLTLPFMVGGAPWTIRTNPIEAELEIQ